jgi:hypothetical protein
MGYTLQIIKVVGQFVPKQVLYHERSSKKELLRFPGIYASAIEFVKRKVIKIQVMHLKCQIITIFVINE